MSDSRLLSRRLLGGPAKTPALARLLVGIVCA